MPRINFLFVLILLLTACTPNATLAPFPTVTLSPIPSVTPTSTATEIPTFANPITPENMGVLTKAGYVWDSKLGALQTISREIVLTVKGDKWVDEKGIENALDALKIVQTNGIDYEGKPIVALLTLGQNEERTMLLPTNGQWVRPIDVAASRAIIDKKTILPTFENWGTYEDVKLEDLSKITWEQFASGLLFYSEQLELANYEWPADVRIPTLKYNRDSNGYWRLSEYQNRGEVFVNTEYGPPKMDGRPIVFENDGVRNFGAYEMIDPITGNKVIIKTQVYLYKQDRPVLLHMFFGDAYVINDEKVWASNVTQKSLSRAPYVITEPIVSLNPGDYNGFKQYFPSGTTKEILPSQDTLANLLGYGGTPIPRSLLPQKLQDLIAKFEEEPITGLEVNDNYSVGAEIYAMQQSVMIQSSFYDHAMGGYLNKESAFK